MWGVCWGNCLPLRVSPISAVTKRIAETFFFDVIAERGNSLLGSNCQNDFSILATPFATFLLLLISFLLLLLLTNLSLHTALHTNVSFLEPSEAGCLIEVSQVYGQSWGEATVNSSLCYQPCGSHNDTDMHTQASTLPHAHKCTHAHTHKGIYQSQTKVCFRLESFSQRAAAERKIVLNGHYCKSALWNLSKGYQTSK